MDVQICDGLITLELTVNDAALLAKACAVAEEKAVMAKDLPDKLAWKAWSVAFASMTVAAVSHYNMLEKHKETAAACAQRLLGTEYQISCD